MQAGNGGYVGGDYSTGKGRRVRDPDASVASGRSWGEDSLPSMRDDIGKGAGMGMGMGMEPTWSSCCSAQRCAGGRIRPNDLRGAQQCLVRSVCGQHGCTDARHEDRLPDCGDVWCAVRLSR